MNFDAEKYKNYEIIMNKENVKQNIPTEIGYCVFNDTK